MIKTNSTIKCSFLLEQNQTILDWQYKCIQSNFIKVENIYIFSAKKDTKYSLINIFNYFLNTRNKKFKKSKYLRKVCFLNNSINKKGSLNLPEESIEIIKKDQAELIVNLCQHQINVDLFSKFRPIIYFENKNFQFFSNDFPFVLKEMILKRKLINQSVTLIDSAYNKSSLAYGESKIYSWSYNKTLREYLNLSPILFDKAIKKLNSKCTLNKINNPFENRKNNFQIKKLN